MSNAEQTYSLRNLALAVAVVALACGWYRDHQQLQVKNTTIKCENYLLRLEWDKQESRIKKRDRQLLQSQAAFKNLSTIVGELRQIGAPRRSLNTMNVGRPLPKVPQTYVPPYLQP